MFTRTLHAASGPYAEAAGLHHLAPGPHPHHDLWLAAFLALFMHQLFSRCGCTGSAGAVNSFSLETASMGYALVMPVAPCCSINATLRLPVLRCVRGDTRWRDVLAAPRAHGDN